MIRIMREKRKQDNLSSFKTIDNIIERFINKSMRKISINEVLQIYENNIDKVISDSIKNEGLKYISGNLILTHKEECININVKCYFQDTNSRWIKKESENNIEIYKIREETITEKQIEFEIEHP